MKLSKKSSFVRGEVYRVDLNPTQGTEIKKVRPCIVISATPINQARGTIIVVPMSSSPSPRPPIVVPVNSMGHDSVAVCDQIRAVDKSRLKEKMGELTLQEISVLEDSLRKILTL